MSFFRVVEVGNTPAFKQALESQGENDAEVLLEIGDEIGYVVNYSQEREVIASTDQKRATLWQINRGRQWFGVETILVIDKNNQLWVSDDYT